MTANRIRLVALLLPLLVLVGCNGSKHSDAPPTATTTAGRVMSISAMPQLDPYPTTGVQYAQVAQAAFDMAYNAGARGQVSTFKWSDLEPNAGQYASDKFDQLNAAIDQSQQHNMVHFLGIQVINTTVNEMPADLAALDFDKPQVIQHFHALLDRILTPANRGRITYLSIGNEVDAYLSGLPDAWSHYSAFYQDAVNYAHQLDPGIKVGVTATAQGALDTSAADMANLNQASDVIILTYYPTTLDAVGNVVMRDPTDVFTDFPRMEALAPHKALVLQEVGYAASPVNASSEAQQAQFVSNVFAAWNQAGDRIPLLNFFLLHDFTSQMCSDFAAYYNIPGNNSFVTFLCTLGLLTADGQPRLAWTTLQQEAKNAGFQ